MLSKICIAALSVPERERELPSAVLHASRGMPLSCIAVRLPWYRSTFGKILVVGITGMLPNEISPACSDAEALVHTHGRDGCGCELWGFPRVPRPDLLVLCTAERSQQQIRLKE